MMKILRKYITTEVSLTLIFTLGIFVFVMMAGVFRDIIDVMVNRAVGWRTFFGFLILQMPFALSLALPVALLAAMLLTFGRMSADNEITAMRASGIGLGWICAPVILLSLVFTALTFFLHAFWAPRANIAAKTLVMEAVVRQPLEFLEEGRYIKEFPGYGIYIGKKRGNIIEDVLVNVLDERGAAVQTIRAQRGVVTADIPARLLKLDLQDVRGDLRDPADPLDVRKIRPGATAARYPLTLDFSAATKRARVTRKIRDLTLPELSEEIRALRAQNVYPAAALLEVHQRAAFAVACVAFTLIGIPLGIRTQRRETSVGIAVSLGLVLLYYCGIFVAQTLKYQPRSYPELIMWAPNIAFEIIGLALWWRVSRV
jgi:LPS export ABC transporter permease LptF